MGDLYACEQEEPQAKAKLVWMSIASAMQAFSVCRAAVTAGSPMGELEVALDAMCDLQAPFHGRYIMMSSIDRRSGGQGIVQFANVSRQHLQVWVQS